MTKQMRYQDQDNKLLAPNQWDYVHPLTDEEAKTQLNSVDDLIKHNIITNSIIRELTDQKNSRQLMSMSRWQMLSTVEIQVRELLEPSPSNIMPSVCGVIMATKMVSQVMLRNKYKDEALSEGHDTLGDDFIIQKVSKGKFQNLEEWKKAWFDAIIAKAKRGIHSFEIDGQQIDSYEKLQDLFDQAVETDYRNFKYGGSVANYTVALKKKSLPKTIAGHRCLFIRTLSQGQMKESVFRFPKEVKTTLAFSKNKIARSPVGVWLLWYTQDMHRKTVIDLGLWARDTPLPSLSKS